MSDAPDVNRVRALAEALWEYGDIIAADYDNECRFLGDASMETQSSYEHVAGWLLIYMDKRVQPEMPQPDWENAPEWAISAAILPGLSHWVFSEAILELDEDTYGWARPRNFKQAWVEYISIEENIPLGIDWRTTLRKRPEDE